MKRKIFIGLTSLLIITSTNLFANDVVPDGNYNKGFKYYSKYIKKPLNIKAPKLIKMLKVENEEQLINNYFIKNGKPFVKAIDKIAKQKFSNKKYEKFKEKEKKLEKIKVLRNIKTFLIGVMQGKIPAGCS